MKSKYFLIFLLFIVLAIFHTFPLILHLDSHIIYIGGDSWQYVWNLWWARKSVEIGSSIFFTSYLDYPFGVSLIMNALMPLRGVVSIPLQYLTGSLITTFNILHILALAFSSFTMFLVCYRITRNLIGSATGGFLFGISHFTLIQHANFIDLYFIPLVFLSILAYQQKPSGKNLFFSVLSGLGLFLTDYYQFFYGMIIVVIYFFYRILENYDKRKLFIQFLIYLAFQFMIISPFILQYLRDDSYYHFYSLISYDEHAANLFSFIVPPENLTLIPLGNLSLIIQQITHLDWISYNQFYLRITPLLFVIMFYRYINGNQFGKYATILFFIALILSFGSSLKIGDKVFNLPLPYSFLAHVPIISNLRTPNRFTIILFFALSIMVAIGMGRLLQDKGRKKSTKLLIVVTFLIVMNLETLIIPVSLYKKDIPNIYKEIGSENEDFTILNVPVRVWSDDEGYLLYQTVHGKPIIGGLISRPSETIDRRYYQMPLIKEIYSYQYINGLKTLQFADSLDNYKKTLRDLKIKYITFSYTGGNDISLERVKRIEQSLVILFNLKMVYNSEFHRIYQVGLLL